MRKAALADTVIGLFKTIAVVHGDRSTTVEYAKLEWFDWFDNRRLLDPIESVLPAEVKANHYARLRDGRVILNQNSLRKSRTGSLLERKNPIPIPLHVDEGPTFVASVAECLVEVVHPGPAIISPFAVAVGVMNEPH